MLAIRSGMANLQYKLAIFVMSGFWLRINMRGSRLNQSKDMGNEAKRSMKIVLCRVTNAKASFFEPKAWLQSGSIPMERPARTE